MVYTDGIHLIADSLDELHEFALKIGLKREWFQDHPKHPHYDLFGSKRYLALEYEIKVVSSKELIKILTKR